jgi:NADH-quinone oxidoreductase subunit J
VSGAAVAFGLVATVLVGSSLAVVLTPNLFHAVLFLAVALVATGVLFLLLGSPFLFAVQLLLYAGGVVTVLVFAIMLTERLVGTRLTQTNRWVAHGALLAAAVFVGVAGFLIPFRGPGGPAGASEQTAELGHALVGPYLGPFELLAVLLVAALLGALYFARTGE